MFALACVVLVVMMCVMSLLYVVGLFAICFVAAMLCAFLCFMLCYDMCPVFSCFCVIVLSLSFILFNASFLLYLLCSWYVSFMLVSVHFNYRVCACSFCLINMYLLSCYDIVVVLSVLCAWYCVALYCVA